MTAYCFGYEFHPVGQGLFASGYLTKCHKKYCYRPRRIRRHDCGPAFTWVYDCGTSSSQKHLTAAIDEYKKDDAASKPTIDLVAISHFDADHISGMTTLVSRFKIKVLLLPYMPLWQRLMTAFQEGVDTQDLMRFYIDPVGYLSMLDGAEIERILFVRSSSEEGPIDETEPPSRDDLDSWDLPFEEEPPADQAEENSPTQPHASKGRRIPVGFLRNGGILSVRSVWEFVPYNDASVVQKHDSTIESENEFRAIVHREAAKFLAGSESESALNTIKDAYDEYFGDSSERRNVISLFLYAGPISRAYARQQMFGQSFRRYESGNKCSILYTGDGYLDTGARFNQMTRYLGNHRMDRVSCFQVMHHGAERNWHEGIAKKISPDCSIFSSDPTHKGFGHPHAPVLRDFWLYGPVQVNAHHGVSIDGCLY